MLKQYKISGFEGRQIIRTELFFDNTHVYIDNEDYYSESNPLCWCPGIFKHNISSNKIDRYTFSQGVRVISRECAKATLYYAFIERTDKEVSVRFRKLNCTNFTDTEILSLISENDKQLEMEDLPFWNISLFGISERYAIAAFPQISFKRGDTYYSKLLLLDAEENKYYTIPAKLGKSDSLLRMNSILVREHDDKTYILIKTGLMACSEKEYSYKNHIAKDTQDEYVDDLETFVCIDTDNFIRFIKEGIEIPEQFIIDTCDYKCSFDYYTIKRNEVNYQKYNFSSETSEIVVCNLESGEISHIKCEGPHELSVLLESKTYCVKYTNECKKLYDIDTKKIIFSTANDEEFLYFNDNDNYVITYQPQGDLNYKVFLHDFNENKLEILGEGWVMFDSEHQILTIFTQESNNLLMKAL